MRATLAVESLRSLGELNAVYVPVHSTLTPVSVTVFFSLRVLEDDRSCRKLEVTSSLNPTCRKPEARFLTSTTVSFAALRVLSVCEDREPQCCVRLCAQ